MTRLTPERVAEIAARAEATTPGDWGVYVEALRDPNHAKTELSALVDGTPDFSGAMHYVTSESGLAPAITGCGKRSAANAEFIAHARADVPALCADWQAMAAEIERLAREVTTVDAQHKALQPRVVNALARALSAERRLAEAEKVVEAARLWASTSSDLYDEFLMDAVDEFDARHARQSPETAPGSDLPEGAATHVAGEVK